MKDNLTKDYEFLFRRAQRKFARINKGIPLTPQQKAAAAHDAMSRVMGWEVSEDLKREAELFYLANE
jgi:hypothetical protein